MDNDQDPIVILPDPIDVPLWMWAVVLIILFFIFFSGIYLSGRGGPDIKSTIPKNHYYIVPPL